MAKVKTSIALDAELLNWVESMIKLKRFASVSHGVEYALQRLREQEKEEFHLPEG